MSRWTKSLSPSVMSEMFGFSDRQRRREAPRSSKHPPRTVAAPPFSWARLLPRLFPSYQLRCGHAGDALKFIQDASLQHTFEAPPSTLTNSFISLLCFGTNLSVCGIQCVCDCVTALFWHESLKTGRVWVCVWIYFECMFLFQTPFNTFSAFLLSLCLPVVVLDGCQFIFSYLFMLQCRPAAKSSEKITKTSF